MTRDETKKIIRIIMATYPNWHPQDLTEIIDAWTLMLEEYTYADISVALKTYILSDSSGFAPAVGQLTSRIADRREQQLEPLAAWALVYKAICNSGYNSESEFEKLPEACRIAVGSPANLREMAMMDVKTVNSVEQSHFLRSYEAAVKRIQENARLPESLRIGFNGGRIAAIEVNNNKLLEVVEG